MTRSLPIVLLLVAACGSTVTSVGTDGDDDVPAEGGADAATVADAHAEASSDASVVDAADPCAHSQCVEATGNVTCAGHHGARACSDGMHTESCTCSPTLQWIDCAGCP